MFDLYLSIMRHGDGSCVSLENRNTTSISEIIATKRALSTNG